jgi:hypothetical protein
MELYFLFQQKEKNHSDSLGDLLQWEAYKTARPHADVFHNSTTASK